MPVNKKLQRLRQGLAAVVLLWAASLAVQGTRQPALQADVRRTTPDKHFQSGAQRSEALLREISATLKSIDARLQRLEQRAEKQFPGGGAAPAKERPRR